MDNLSVFQAPIEGELTLCDVDGRTHSMNYELADICAFTTAVEKHPNILITADMIQSHRRGNEAKSLFLPVEEPFLKRIVQAYTEQGLLEVLVTSREYGPGIVSKIAGVILTLIDHAHIVRCKLTSKSTEDPISLMSEISQTRFWYQSSIRCIAWHDYHMKLAVATSDDAVRIFSSNSAFTPVLKCKQQTNITCLAWRPLSNMEIAVGCENGILIWSVDHSSMITKHSINNVTYLHRVAHKPVVSLAWNKGGDILASAAASDSSILMWNVEMNETSSLKEPSGYGNCLLKWSPTGNKLLSATSNLIFRVWECRTWKAERWSILTGRIQACCWSPCGTTLLFVTSTEPLIYALSFVKSEMIFASSSENSPNKAVAVYDLSKGDLNGFIVGGVVTNMEWDTKMNYVAVLFRDTNYVAIFRVSVRPVVKLLPCCLVSGCPEEKAMCIAFQGNFSDGACLSIGWSSGRIQHFPIIHSEVGSSLSNTPEQLDLTNFYNYFNSGRSLNASQF